MDITYMFIDDLYNAIEPNETLDPETKVYIKNKIYEVHYQGKPISAFVHVTETIEYLYLHHIITFEEETE